MPSFRGFTKRAFRCGLYEAQDVLVEVDDVDLISLEPSRGLSWKKQWQKKILYHDLSRRLVFANPGLRRVRLKQEYDLFVAVVQDCWDVPYINAIDGWKDQCKTSVCWLDEIWASSIPGYKYLLHALRQFDHVFVGYRGSVAPLAEAIGQPCHWLPGGVDTMRFSSYPNSVERVIDVYSMGRRWEGIHHVLLDAAERRDMFYIHDTFLTASDRDVSDHRQHRDLYANMAKRSRFFLVAPGKMNDLGETGGQVEVGYRYFEGAAAGAVMIGQAPKGEAFKDLFPWPEAVTEIQPDGSDVLGVLDNLGSEPERVTGISRRNSVGALLHHDWIYRWKTILQTAGIELSPAMVARENNLKKLAALNLKCE
jgi:hypothetical protein